MTSNNGGGLIVVVMVVGFVALLASFNWLVESVAWRVL
jgi:hypothetical protein